ncbi:hypothetical protein OG978_47385 (plasmid) [Streptomyces sp. NBC_01591]|uniref:hypothetical protein n=1 Tax=Streptomyces sp. NBC_01591 TaxID=2975888 RepID=UPI002DDC8675|nr:hypothetical protein [Streptomyces sp. NBC_01591]WSD66008.1 hypothetical protein OG978_00035 [Streptomyces sp. NBC_01591]WSD73111.1 hypothetical protein OG978_40790 [Streptomyces sp. NBC_01591]WSD73616.1 hypothetical protein OG978_40855 [Streptomyces sp. NBC_01591]WSD74597.1 hypothetical protein OG978_47385 [Streptomyces sp. NBC_01591]
MPGAPVSACDITVCYLDRFGRQRECPVSEAGEVPFEELAPLERPVPYPGRQSFVTNAWASATDQLLACGSLRQQRCGMVLDRDLAVGLRSAGPMELRWSQQGRRHRLRPAFVALRAGWREVICVQPEQFTDRWQSEQAVLAVAAAAAGWQIRVMEPPTGVELDNLQLLYAARSPRWLTAGQDQLLAQQFTSPRTIRSGLRAAALPPYAGVDLAYHLIWAQRLHTDMGVPLTPSSTAWARSGEAV